MKRRLNAPSDPPPKSATRRGSRAGDATEALRHTLRVQLAELRRVATNTSVPLTVAEQQRLYAQMRALEHSLRRLG